MLKCCYLLLATSSVRQENEKKFPNGHSRHNDRPGMVTVIERGIIKEMATVMGR